MGWAVDVCGALFVRVAWPCKGGKRLLHFSLEPGCFHRGNEISKMVTGHRYKKVHEQGRYICTGARHGRCMTTATMPDLAP
jgi:hypothetical protein